MSLATTCPHCHTTFKIAKDQLKLKAGLVRCGICQQVFNGVAHLVGDATQAEKEINTTFIQSPSTSDVSNIVVMATDVQDVPIDVLADIEASEEAIIVNSKPEDVEVELMMLNNSLDNSPDNLVTEIPVDQSHPANQFDETQHKIQDLSFIRQANSKKRGTRLFSIGVLVLSLLLIGQAIYHFRDLIAAGYPSSKKTLVTLCNYLHCQIQLPAQLNALSYDADELHTLAHDNMFEFSLLLRNRSAFIQTWPHIELTLKNAQKQTVLRRVFTPAEYLRDPSEAASGFRARQEYAVELYFEMTQVVATDYAVAIFYP